MIIELAKKAIVTLAVVTFVIFVLYQFFTDPVGSAHFVSSIVGGIIDGGNSIITFVKAL